MKKTILIRVMPLMVMMLGMMLHADTIRVPVVDVVSADEMLVRNYPGRVVPVAEVKVVAQVAGEILEVGFENGTHVKEGTLLYRLDPVKYEAAVKNAEAKVAECKATVSYSELSYQRHRKLLATRAVSLDAVDNALSARDSARASYAAAQAELISARDDLKHCRITAPISGKLGSTQFTKGNYVTTQSGTLVTLIQTSPIRVRFAMSNADFLEMFGAGTEAITRDGIVTLTLADGRAYEEKGTVEYVENAADESTDTILVYALFKNAQNILKPGGTMVVTLKSAKAVKKPAVPPLAVLQDFRGSFVWVVGANGVAEQRYVRRGVATDKLQLIDEGLKAGERVVSDGVHKVSKGDKIEAVK